MVSIEIRPIDRAWTYTRAMHGTSMAVALAWPERVDLSGHRLMLDIGGVGCGLLRAPGPSGDLGLPSPPPRGPTRHVEEQRGGRSPSGVSRPPRVHGVPRRAVPPPSEAEQGSASPESVSWRCMSGSSRRRAIAPERVAASVPDVAEEEGRGGRLEGSPPAHHPTAAERQEISKARVASTTSGGFRLG
jgi:hypothetical protein